MPMGTVIITGANSSLGIPAVGYLLSNYSTSTVVLTVRDDSEQDTNTAKLRAIIARSPANANISIRKLDLASLAAVQKFTDEIQSEIARGQILPLVAVIWNAMSWTLHGGLNFTPDGYERSIAINHIAHFAMSLRLLGSFDPEQGRIVFLSSDSHEKSALQQFPSTLPDDPDLLVHPPPDKGEEIIGRGFQRYGLSKLVIIMTMYELNRRLKQGRRETSNDLKGLFALAVDPGGLLDSRAFSGPDVPRMWSTQVYIANLLQPLLKLLNPAFRRSADAARDVIDLAVGPQYAGKDGYFIMRKKADSSDASKNSVSNRYKNEDMQGILWKKSLEWAGINQKDTALPL
ncbi:NAD(P)-binding protein [Lindgomyces ingoldianus]|uniref:NAD(P)-binding protein n=1 Tax=Lindgomyces ingoldianus TaxID=673940 RepID=A0ACB6QDM1_9PLEO|nr:NAD(P)-binding protein [Lindgomyces ingoldianus]KAF2465119.1 NAD(P)-binding protein [Lindgomyces ingoldianus]